MRYVRLIGGSGMGALVGGDVGGLDGLDAAGPAKVLRMEFEQDWRGRRSCCRSGERREFGESVPGDVAGDVAGEGIE